MSTSLDYYFFCSIFPSIGEDYSCSSKLGLQRPRPPSSHLGPPPTISLTLTPPPPLSLFSLRLYTRSLLVSEHVFCLCLRECASLRFRLCTVSACTRRAHVLWMLDNRVSCFGWKCYSELLSLPKGNFSFN